MSFTEDMDREIARVTDLYLAGRAAMAVELLDVAHAAAPHESGRLRAGIVPFAGSPPGPPGEGAGGGAAGVLAPASLRAQAVELSRAVGLRQPFGVASTVDYADHAEARQPYMQPALEAAERMRVPESGGGR